MGTKLTNEAAGSREGMIKKIISNKIAAKDEELFSKHDATGDGFWKKDDVKNFAKKEYNFEMTQEALNRFFELSVLPAGSPGVPKENIHLAVAAVGIARDAARGKVLKQEKEEENKKKAAAIEEKKKLFKKFQSAVAA